MCSAEIEFLKNGAGGKPGKSLQIRLSSIIAVFNLNGGQLNTLSGMDKKQINKGYAAALGSALVLSLTAIFIRFLTQSYQLPALVLAFWREMMVALGLAVILTLTKPDLL